MQAMAITQAAPRTVPRPVKISTSVQIPTHRPPKVMMPVERSRDDYDRQEQGLPFRLHETHAQLPAALALEEARQSATLQFDVPKGSEAPSRPTAEVHLNASAIYREDSMYKRRQRVEEQQLKEYEAALRDGTEYDCPRSDRSRASPFETPDSASFELPTTTQKKTPRARVG